MTRLKTLPYGRAGDPMADLNAIVAILDADAGIGLAPAPTPAPAPASSSTRRMLRGLHE